MSIVYIEKPSPEEVTFNLVTSLQKIGFVASAGLVDRSLEERKYIFNPTNNAHVESMQTIYSMYAKAEGLYVAMTRRMGREEAVGYALVDKVALEADDTMFGDVSQTQSTHIDEFTIVPCDTVPVHEVSTCLIKQIQDYAEQEVTASVLAENLFALYALKSQGFMHDIRTYPWIRENYFGEGTRPVLQHQLVLPVSKSLAMV